VEPATKDDERAHEAAEDAAADAGREHADAQDEERLEVAPSEGGARVEPARRRVDGRGRVVDRVLECVMNALARGEAEDEGEEARQERDDEGLDLEEGEVAEDEGAAREAQVELADVGRGREACCEVHLEVALEVEEDRDEDEELLDADEDAPGLQGGESARS